MFLQRALENACKFIALRIPLLRDIRNTAGTAAPITWRGLFAQKVLGINRNAYWPMHFTSHVSGIKRIRIGIGTAPGLSPGCYIQGRNGIEIGDYTVVGPNVGIISANHDPHCPSHHLDSGPIRIGRHCWIGMNAVILSEITLGDHTIVAAGAVVTHSFPEGYCIIGGVPARVIRTLTAGEVTERRYPHEYIGFYPLNKGTAESFYQRLGIERVHDVHVH